MCLVCKIATNCVYLLSTVQLVCGPDQEHSPCAIPRPLPHAISHAKYRALGTCLAPSVCLCQVPWDWNPFLHSNSNRDACYPTQSTERSASSQQQDNSIAWSWGTLQQHGVVTPVPSIQRVGPPSERCAQKAKADRNPIPQNSWGVKFCLSYHVLGFYWNNCGKVLDYQPHSAANTSKLMAWCGTCYRAGGPNKWWFGQLVGLDNLASLDTKESSQTVFVMPKYMMSNKLWVFLGCLVSLVLI